MKISKNVLKFILGLKIKKLRSRHDLSLKDLANKSGLSVSYLNEIEKGKKYPKVEKLAELAGALDCELEELVSLKTGRNLHPLLKFLESDLVAKLPLDLFGLTEQDVIDLISSSPEKFASFVVTVLEISRSHDIKLDDLYSSALRSYIEVNDNYFPHLEKLAKQIRKKIQSEEKYFSVDMIKLELSKTHGFLIDEETLDKDEFTKGQNFAIRYARPKTVYINERLNHKQKVFYLTKALSEQHLEAGELEGLEEKKRDFHASYLAGAILLDEIYLKTKVKEFFSLSSFQPNFILELLNSSQVSTEVFCHRLTQILPHHFGLNQLFFLGSRLNEKGFEITKELHLSKLHNPHAVRMGEHYCRRWIAYKVIDKLKGSHESKLIDGQISEMENGDQYLSISIARISSTKESTYNSLTIGVYLDDTFKKNLSFLSDLKLPIVKIARTCERCTIADCQERAAPGHIAELIAEEKNKELAILRLLNN